MAAGVAGWSGWASAALMEGIDMIDSLTFNDLQHLDQGQVTLDRIEVRAYDKSQISVSSRYQCRIEAP